MANSDIVCMFSLRFCQECTFFRNFASGSKIAENLSWVCCSTLQIVSRNARTQYDFNGTPVLFLGHADKLSDILVKQELNGHV